MDANGGNQRRLTNHPNYDEAPSWSPDGRSIAFDSAREGVGEYEVYVMDANGENQSRLTRTPGVGKNNLNPVWSPDGGSIVFASTRDGNPEIYVMDVDGSNQRRLTYHPDYDWSPDWFDPAFARAVSPAGKLKGTWGRIKALLRRY